MKLHKPFKTLSLVAFGPNITVIAETPFFKNEKRKEKFCFQSQVSRVEMRNFILSLKP